MKIIGNRIHIAPRPQLTKTPGGIHLPDQYPNDANGIQFTVLAVGPGKVVKGRLIPIEAKPGDRIVATLYHDHTTMPDGSRIIDADQVIAVVGV